MSCEWLEDMIDPYKVVGLVHYFFMAFIIVLSLSLLGNLQVLGDDVSHCKVQAHNQ
jgi:hypothetical protein